MDADPPVVAPGLDQEHAAWRAVQHAESALAVVGEDRRFLGFLPPHRLLEVLLAEHDEDMTRLGGFLLSTSKARMASEESVAHRFWHRLPWLLAGLAGALFAAATVVAMLLPWALDRLGKDPAFGSGPLATVIQDLLSILIYFGVASLVVG